MQDLGFKKCCFLLVTEPLRILRDYSIPMSEPAVWNKNRAAISPSVIPFAFLILNGRFEDQ